MKKKITYGPNDVVVVWACLVMCCRGGSHGTCGCGVVARGGRWRRRRVWWWWWQWLMVMCDALAPLMMAVCFVIHSHREPYVGC